MADVGARIVAGGCSTEQLVTIRKDRVFSRRTWSLFFRCFSAVFRVDMEPYRRLFGRGLSAVMASHVVYLQVDASPTGLSSRWLLQILRGKLG